MKAFISYSHKDTKYRERLSVHLKPLERLGGIQTWYDRKLYVGDDLGASIDENLHDSDIFIAIVSPDYLASYYCYEKEMTAAFERHARGEMQVVSIIVEPCVWQSTPLGKLKAVPEDGKPVSDWSNPNNAYVDVVRELQKLISRPSVAASARKAKPAKPTHKEPESQVFVAPKYRTKKTFSKIDKLKFVQSSFEIIANRLEEWVAEINNVNGVQAHFESMDKDRFYLAIVNRDRGNRTAERTVFLKSDSFALADISIVHKRTKESNSVNGGFSVSHDDYEMFFQETMSFTSRNARLSADEAAARLWESMLVQAEITYV